MLGLETTSFNFRGDGRSMCARWLRAGQRDFMDARVDLGPAK
jgi:hypothetical protein